MFFFSEIRKTNKKPYVHVSSIMWFFFSRGMQVRHTLHTCNRQIVTSASGGRYRLLPVITLRNNLFKMVEYLQRVIALKN